jgi:DNA polymerase I-like protein with 3'-5' exonuclease and polymerase domains
VAIDTETTGLHWKRDQIFGFSISHPEGGFYYDIRRNPEAASWLRDFVRDYHGRIIFHNVNFDYKFLTQVGVYVPLEKIEDTVIMASLIDEHRSTVFPWTKGKTQGYSLDSLARTYLGLKKMDEIYPALAELFGGMATRNVQMPNLHRAPPELVAKYAIRDTDLTSALWEVLRKEIDRQELHDVLAFEYITIPHVLDQEMRGIRVDLEAAHKASSLLEQEIDLTYREIEKIVGRPDFNVNSTPQIRDYYSPTEGEGGWVLANGVPCKTTAKGNPSIDNEVLQSMVEFDPLASKIIEVRSLIRTKDTFLEGHVIGSSVDGRVYPTINQVSKEEGGTSTGRFSYVGPALQQIPNRNKTIAAIVKPCFLPDEGQVWLDGDLNSFEVRIFAHLVGQFNRGLVAQYASDPLTDFHKWVADLMSVPRDPQPTGGANAKQLNLSMIFNSGKGAIAHQLGYPTTPDSFTDDQGTVIKFNRCGPEAERVIEDYHRRIQGVKELANRVKSTAEKRGYIFTKYGRRLRFPRKYKSYKASGLLIQATAADINKDNWRIISEALDSRGRLMLNTHDSYSMSVDEDKVDESWKDVKYAVEQHDLRVPLILDKNGVGPNWWAALQG